MATFGFQYNPKNEYLMAPTGKIRLRKGYPQYAFQLTKSFDNWLDGAFDFTQVNFRIRYDYERLRKSTTSFLIQGGAVFGDAPISHLYNATPNYQFRNPWASRINFGGINASETYIFIAFAETPFKYSNAR